MKAKIVLIVSLTSVMAGLAAPNPSALYSDLERHLQSLKSLEVHYDVDGTNVSGGGISGRLIWLRPDRFYHDTPEWTLCEIKGEQWRYLKAQNTLIREKSNSEEQWTPERVITDLGDSYRPESLDEAGDGTRTLYLVSRNVDSPGRVALEFPPETRVPDRIRFELVDGTYTDYQITGWDENITVDSELFSPPDVPAENIIDFRAATEGQR